MCQFDWLNIFYFQAKFGKERVRANKVIVNYPKSATRFAQFGGWFGVRVRVIVAWFHDLISRKTFFLTLLSRVRLMCTQRTCQNQIKVLTVFDLQINLHVMNRFLSTNQRWFFRIRLEVNDPWCRPKGSQPLGT